MIPVDKWDGRFMQLAALVSTWSKDPSTRVGAVIVDNHKRIVSMGYNGFPSKLADLPERLNDRETKYSLTIHAEKNALLNANFNGASTRDCTMYVYGLPICSSCANDVIQAGITSVVLDGVPGAWDERWRSSGADGIKKFLEAEVRVRYFERTR